MKPPPRARTKRISSSGTPELEPRRKAGCKWGRVELKKLLTALKTLDGTTGGLEEIDYVVLQKHIPTRSVSEVSVMVNCLKKKTMASARLQLHMKNWEEKHARTSIEEWMHMASTLAGTLKTVISAAFSQMLIVSSTEPCTLRNCDPYQDSKPAIGRTVPFGPVPCMPVKGENPASIPPAVLIITPAPTMSGSRRLPAPSKVARVHTRKILPPQKETTPTATTSTSQNGCPDTNSLSPAGQTAPLLPGKRSASSSLSSPKPLTILTSHLSPFPTTAQSPVASHCLPLSNSSSSHSTDLLSNTSAELHTNFGQTNKHATAGCPRSFGVKCIVDFEKIYKFLSAVQNPSEDRHLTPMESAIVLDLLMSLPEELPHLDCQSLRTYLILMYRSISAPVETKPAKQLLSKVKNAWHIQRETPTAQDPNLMCSQGAETAGAAPVSLDTDKGHTSSDQSKDADVLEFGPPLNPFLIPLNMLMRRQSSE